jgi:dihydrofolate synthase/folylpolyglutamate synthase
MDNIEVAYNHALDYLYSFVDFSMQKSTTYSPARFKLERMVALAESLGDPQQAYPTIHVAGTKGKGSVAVLCASALQEAGYCVGLYTSPHLDDYAERIQINRDFISHADMVEMVEMIKPFVSKIPELTTFEITTALAFLYFKQQRVDVAVIEVGLGGRLDATNVVNPVVSVITSISYDHTHLLGNTLAEIAREKAGIIKPGVPVVSSYQVDEAQVEIMKIAHERHARLIQVGRDVHYEQISHSLDGQTFRIWLQDFDYGASAELSIPFLGAHQVENAATAYAALDIFRNSGLRVPIEAIKRGFSNAFWPGRFEIVHQNPAIILDCAHNRDSALKLRLTVEEYFPGKKIRLIFGASEDKDIFGMFAELMPAVKELLVVKSFHPRAIEPEKLVDMAQSYGCKAIVVDHIPDAVEKALDTAGEAEVILITGSIFVVAEARKYLQDKTDIRRY